MRAVCVLSMTGFLDYPLASFETSAAARHTSGPACSTSGSQWHREV
jgi:hypothetical protein